MGDAITSREVTFTHAWNVRGNAARGEFAAALQGMFGMPVPRHPNTIALAPDRAFLWLGPRSWLCIGEALTVDFDSTRDALNAAGGALFDVSASYVMWRVSGANVARVLNRMCPLDLHDASFPAGFCAQSLLGHITTIVYRPTRACAFLLLVPRSFAQDAWDHLHASAASEGHVLQPALRFGEAQLAGSDP